WIKQLVSAVQTMHEYGVAHRAIKLQHVMLHDNQVQVSVSCMKTLIVILIATFFYPQVSSWTKAVHFWDENTKPGYQCLLLQHRERRSRKNRHMPPECFSTPCYDPSKVDLWSVGVIAVALTTSRYPFN